MALNKTTARSLAVSYAAFVEARQKTASLDATAADYNSLACWATALKQAQAATGVVFRDPADLERIVENARTRRDQLEPQRAL